MQIEHALSLPGVVHVDAAEMYGTYAELGKALANTSKPRDQIWITDKFSKVNKTPREGLEYSLKNLGVDYVDLYLLHDPFYNDEKPGYDVVQAWKYMEELQKEGKAKNIGVSNFAVEDLEKVLAIAEIKPVVNQIEYSAFLQNQTPGIYEYAKEKNILLEAYSPLTPLTYVKDHTGPFYDYLNQLASKYNQDNSIVLLRWVYQTGVLPITTSSKPERVNKFHTAIWEFELTDEEVAKISKLGNEHKPARQWWTDKYSKFDN